MIDIRSLQNTETGINKSSLRAKLMVSIILIVAMTLNMGIFSYFVAERTRSDLQDLYENGVTLSVYADHVHSRTETIISLADAMIVTNDATQVKKYYDDIKLEIQKQNELVATISGKELNQKSRQILESLVSTYTTINNSIESLKVDKQNILRINQELEGEKDAIQKKYNDFTKHIVPLADNMLFSSILGIEGIKIKGQRHAVDAAREVELMVGVLELKAEGNHLFGIMEMIANLSDEDGIIPLEDRLTSSASMFIKDYNEFSKSYKRQIKDLEIPDLDPEGLVESGHRLIEIKKRQLGTDSQLSQSILSMRKISTSLESDLADFTEISNKNVEAYTNDASRNLEAGQFFILIICLGCVVTATLIAWQCIHKILIVRLERLRRNMMAIACGQFNADLTEKYDDEISEMAKSVIFFRETLQSNVLLNYKLKNTVDHLEEARKEAEEIGREVNDIA